MDLYIIETKRGAPCFAGTQAAAKAKAREIGGVFAPIIVPDRKEERLAWLNVFCAELVRQHTPCSHAIPAHVGSPVPCPEKRERDMNPEAVLSRMDGPPNIDSMIETICNSSGYPLKRFAGAVAVAFNNLAKGS